MKKTDHCVIIGAGATGLFLSLLLSNKRINITLLEKKTEITQHSKSIGIHPPSLELFRDLNIDEGFTQKGNHVNAGVVFSDNSQLGILSFENCKKPFNYVLSLPQSETEAILEQEINDRSNINLIRGAEVIDVIQEKNSIQTSYSFKGIDNEIESDYVIDCSGKHALIRDKMGISFNEMLYPDTYVMGDFKRTNQPNHEALIFLNKTGVIESFPLPNQVQRWVYKTKHHQEITNPEELVFAIQEKTNQSIDVQTNSMFSTFNVQKGIAHSLVSNRYILCGDAAHIISPIGGQGMNLAWLNAHTLTQALVNGSLSAYQRKAKKRWRTAVSRSEFNMKMGREHPIYIHKLKQIATKLLLSPILRQQFANQFSMRGI